jgi:hypothetical protein
VAALASGLLFLPLTQGAATPADGAGLKSITPVTPSPVELVGHGGGGGGHGGGGGGGGHGGGWSGGGGGGAGKFSGGGNWSGARNFSSGGGNYGGARHSFSGGGNWSAAKSFSSSGGHGRSDAYSGRHFDNGGARLRHGGSYAWQHDHDNWNGNNWNGHHWNGPNGRRYGHYRRYYPDIFVYGGDYGYGYDSCDWLLRQAELTGSPVWWNRYYACAG